MSPVIEVSELSKWFGEVVAVNNLTVTVEAGQVHEHCRAAAALDERADRRRTGPDDQIAFPVARQQSLLNFLGTVLDAQLFEPPRLSWRPFGLSQATLA